MKIAIIGAGISGLSAARLLSSKHEITVFERSSMPGGIARPKMVNGISYHTTGGHCFNSKYKKVTDFVFDQILPKRNWHKVVRKSNIVFRDIVIPYPIEYSIKHIHQSYPEIAEKIIKEFLNANSSQKAGNLDLWFRNNFGDTLAEEYFIPYNKKIWNMEPKEMSHEWVKSKLPMPDKKSFVAALFSDQRDTMPHSEFYYPNSNSQIEFIESLANNLNIKYNYKIGSIESHNGNKGFTINDKYEFDYIVSTIPLNSLPGIIKNCPESIKNAASELKYNKVTTMLWETKGYESTWTYLPSEKGIYHRYIHIGNFFSPKGNYTIAESIGSRSKEEMLECGYKDSNLLKAIDYNISDHAYVVFDDKCNASRSIIFDYLEKVGISTLGRFGQWDYFNMDICIHEAMKLTEKINDKFH